MDMEFYLFQALYIGLCILYLVVGIDSNNRAVKAVLKCAPIVSLIVSAVLYSITFGMHMGPIGHKESKWAHERLVFALIFSCLGDLYLVFRKTFLLGVISFAIAQCIYIALFGGSLLTFLHPTPTEITTAVAIGMVSFLVYFYILPKLNWILIVPFFAYCILISTMLWCAVNKMLQAAAGDSVLGAVGACLFFTSDLMIALRARMSIPYGGVLVMVTYYAAQLLISLSVIVRF